MPEETQEVHSEISSTERDSSFRFGVMCMAIAYIVATAVAVAAGYVVRAWHPLLVVLAADAAATVAVFAFSVAFRNSSFYDPYWSVGPIVIVAYFHAIAVDEVVVLRQFLAGLLVVVWGVRLTFNFLRGWRGLPYQDWRYDDLQQSAGKAYWLVSFAGIHMFPTLLVYGGCLALYPAIAGGTRPFGILDLLATFVTATAVWLEALADRQLRAFVVSDHKPGETLRTGLWAHSRHPNYLGEIALWWGLYLYGLAADPGFWWSIAGPLAITLLFIFISLPMIEKRHLERRPDYPEYQKTTPILIPWLRRRA